jgi:Putative prokaryotic signal transducing protein
MEGKLETVLTCMNTAEAMLTVQRLQNAGIESFVADDNIVSMDFLLGNAIGWIKVQVRDEDADRALELLEGPPEPPVPEDEIPWDQPPEEPADADEVSVEEREVDAQDRNAPDEPDIPQTEGERIVDRAYRIAMMGMILFPPLPHFYSFALLMRVAFGREPLPQRANRRYYLTFMIDIGFILVLSWIWIAAIVWFVSLFLPKGPFD